VNKNEITKRDDIQQLSSIKKPNRELSNTTSKGTIIIEGMYGTIRFERRLLHTKEIVWKAITEQKEIFRWLPDYKGTFEGYKGGTIDLINTVSGSHVTGKVLVFDLYHLFEHEWHILPNQMFPKGEPESVIKWDLKKADESDTLLTVTHSKLTKSTALTFAPGWHAYLDRLEAILDNQVPPNWAHRFAEVKELYSTR
jgi:uncharacterized protein YndB with AHSA1/START domain